LLGCGFAFDVSHGRQITKAVFLCSGQDHISGPGVHEGVAR
jgi:hypothetical protein